MLKWVKDNYDDPEIIITENGYSDDGEINDIKRIKYYQVSRSFLDTFSITIHPIQTFEQLRVDMRIKLRYLGRPFLGFYTVVSKSLPLSFFGAYT